MKNGPNRGKADRGGEKAHNQGLQVRGLNLLNLFDQFGCGERPSVNQNLTGELFGAGARAFETRQQAHLELGLDAGDLVLAEALLRRLEQLVADHGDQLMRPVGASRGAEAASAACQMYSGALGPQLSSKSRTERWCSKGGKSWGYSG